MKWFLSGRTRHKNYIRDFKIKLKECDVELSHDWTNPRILKPDQTEADRCRHISRDVTKAISESDVFIMISDSNGTDMLVQLGIAISNAIEKGNPRIYVVGDHNKRSVMHFHPKVIHAESINHVFYKECPHVPFN